MIPDLDPATVERLTLRLQHAGLRATAARLDILHLIEQPEFTEDACAERLFQHLVPRAHHYSMGTVYRTIHQLEACGLLQRNYDAQGRLRYRHNPATTDPHSWRLLCANHSLCISFEDPALHARINELLQQHGLAGFTGKLQLESFVQPHPAPDY